MQLKTTRLQIRLITSADQRMLEAFYTKNASHFVPWMPTNFSIPTETMLKQWEQQYEEDKAVRFLLFHNEELIGLINFTNIIRGAFQACFLGYNIDKEYEGKGFMREALHVTIAYMFEEKKLHRIMANYMPANTRSANLLARLGFDKEGLAKEYVHINNRWEDHVLCSLRSNTSALNTTPS